MMRVVPEKGSFGDINDYGNREDADPELADAFGPFLLAQRHPVLMEYLKQRDGFVSEALEQLGRAQRAGSDERRAQRLNELQHEQELIHKASAKSSVSEEEDTT
jgi:hypothetical protein